MACATPVLAFRCGSAPEIVDQRVTGCLVGSLDEAIRVMPELLRIDRRGVRLRFEERFSAQRMANDYLDVYRSLNGSAEAGSVRNRLPRGLNVIPLPKRNSLNQHVS